VIGALLQYWRALAGDDAEELGQRLIAAYAEPQRHYHGQSHLHWLLKEARNREALILDRRFVGFAIWFHDAIYLPGEPDNEARSAVWAETELVSEPDLAARVGAAIHMTKHHDQGEADSDMALFLDMDTAILGAPWEAYCVYAAGIRAEYPHLPDPTFAGGRVYFLEQQLARARIFRTDLYESELGSQARANMGWELEEMRKGRMVRA
jgi:predicted metal-dependent HD superfamily phosphohydrolase